VWTLLFARLLLGEMLTRVKLVTVFVSLVGMTLVTLSAHGTSGAAPDAAAAAAASSGLTGDLLALMSAAASGVYMVLLPVCVPDKDAVHMPSLFGMMGLVCTLALLPLFPLLHYCGVESFELPPSRSATIALLVNAATSTVLPDMLLAKAVMMTSPLVATLGLSLMIPISVFVDYVRGLARLSPQFFIGTFAVLVGFQLESMAEAPEPSDRVGDDHADDHVDLDRPVDADGDA